MGCGVVVGETKDAQKRWTERVWVSIPDLKEAGIERKSRKNPRVGQQQCLHVGRGNLRIPLKGKKESSESEKVTHDSSKPSVSF